ncbi:hypothetical protein OTB20_08495 [Streptomyces sp. H27-H1]|uniref:hypothetical protein n=1 Tax=Streptomyces sp. H27-H1 TaxID=2996461 RepID=UPI00226EE8EB|nr:hypothetical protein [Streptomyces sp. H27-H1]MCY0926244.1 hypothetical protein [Streptomyces sp. H27-H1]
MSNRVTGYPGHFILDGDTSTCPCPEHRNGPAREELERAASEVGSPEYDVWFGLLLDAYVTEALHEAARRMEGAGCDDDAVAFLDLLADGGWTS